MTALQLCRSEGEMGPRERIPGGRGSVLFVLSSERRRLAGVRFEEDEDLDLLDMVVVDRVGDP